LGNEAGDADSLVSSLCYAYRASERDRRAQQVHGSSAPAAFAHIPVLSVPRGDLALRPETVALLGLAGLGHIAADDSSPLLYFSDTAPAPPDMTSGLALALARRQRRRRRRLRRRLRQQ